MNERPRIAILTSNEIRHRYFVNELAASHAVVGVVYLSTGYHPADAGRKMLEDAGREDEATASVLARHFEDRTREEHSHFGRNAQFLQNTSACPVRHLTFRDLNTAATAAFLEGQWPELVIVYGTTLIREPLLSRFGGRMVNMHLGLSPYYRGTATNFYPLVNGEPQFVGATIHLIDAGIDTGAILRHARPEVLATDMPHTLGCRAILSGIEKLKLAIADFEGGSWEPVPQWRPPHPRLYLRKDYHPKQVVRLYELIAEGLFPKYVANRGSKPQPRLVD